MSVASLSRLYHTLRFYRPRQVIHRLLAWAKRAGHRRRLMKLWQSEGLPIRARLCHIARPVGQAAQLVDSDRGLVLRVLNRDYPLATGLSWRAIESALPDRLSRFQLHYHEFLLGEGDGAPRKIDKRVWDWLADWIELYTSPRGSLLRDAWHPYVVSRRIPAWVWLLSTNPPSETLQEKVLRLLMAQARWLRANLEYDLGGNHLLQNLRALAIAGAFFRGSEPDEWLRTVYKLLPGELDEQILPHGEHFERSPAYHVDMLVALADITEALRSVDPQRAEWLEPIVERMLGFLGAVIHPDGSIPLFGDSTFDLAPSPQEVFSRLGRGLPQLRPAEPVVSVVGDYWTYRHKGDYLIFDAGPIGPDHLPAHAHADLLTIEASVAGRRLIVDTGVYDYEASPERAFCRSTAAHSVLEIDGENQCDVWSRFRMGRRGWPGLLCSGRLGPFHWAGCTHSAYRFRKVPSVGRLVACSPSHGWIIVDWAIGFGQHELVSRLKVGPDWRVSELEASTALVQSESELIVIESLGNQSRLKQGRSVCFPRFGCREPVTELVQRWEGSLPQVLGWQIRRSWQPRLGFSWKDGSVVVDDGTAKFAFDLDDLWI